MFFMLPPAYFYAWKNNEMSNENITLLPAASKKHRNIQFIRSQAQLLSSR
jgi:hypothetical protein